MLSYELSMLINGVSLLLGVGAWVWGILAILAPTAANAHRNTVVSGGCCAAALVCQLSEIAHRAGVRDYAAIEDTIRAVLIAAVALAVSTVVLGVAAVIKARKK